VWEASALAAAGHDVVLMGPVLTEQHAAEDEELLKGAAWQYLQTVDLRAKHSSQARRLMLRGMRRLGGEAVRYTGIQLADSLGYGVRQTLDLVGRMPWDLHIGHQEVGCWTSWRLAKRGRRVAADFEDWYSRDLLPAAQKTRPLRLLQECEHFLLHHASYVSTTSHAMAAAMQHACGGKSPEVVYNLFPWGGRTALDNLILDRVDKTKPSLHWVSKVIGPGRGLELLFEALKAVTTPVEVHLRGAHSQQSAAELRNRFPEIHGHRLFLHGPCPARQLLSRISEHDIGLALELNHPASRDLTVTYKLFHYLVGGLAVIATDTRGQAEIAASIPDAVTVASQGDPYDLASKINELVINKQRLVAAKAAALAAAETRFCCERQAPAVASAVERALARNADTAS
jgi:glycosyltransferase involved in cell wall biosynthesis